MKNRDLLSNGILLGLSFYVLLECRKFQIWADGLPAEGFFPLLLALFLGSLSGFSLLQVASRKKPTPPSHDSAQKVILWKKLIGYLAALVAYSLCFNLLGFLVSSALFLIFILRFVEKLKWFTSMMITGSALFISHFLFDKLLMVPLPGGILRWFM